MEKLVTEIHAFFPDFNMSMNDLKNPTVGFIRDFYSRVLIELGVDSDNVRKAQIEQLEYAQDIDLLPILNLITTINFAFPFLKINLFDMLQPSPNRNAMLMSKVMNFMEFCEARVAANNDEIRKFQEAKSIENELLEIREIKVKEINDLACKVDSCHHEKKELKLEIQSLENGCYENRKHLAKLKEGIQMLEENLTVLDKECQSVKCELSSTISEIDALKRQIVANPDEEKRDLDAKLQHKYGILEKKKDLEDKLKEYKETKEKMQQQTEVIERRVMPIIKELEVLRISQETEILAQKTKMELDELQKHKEKCLKDLEGIHRNAEVKQNNLKSQMSLLEKDEETLRQTLEERKSEYSLKLKEIKTQRKCMQEQFASVNKDIMMMENEYKELLLKFNIAKEAVELQLLEATKGKHNSGS